MFKSAAALTVALLSALSSGPAGAQGVAPGRTLRVNGFEMYVEIRGTGDPLVLLHGFGSCGKGWAAVADSLAGRYQLIVPDLRGHVPVHQPLPHAYPPQSALDVYGC